MPAFSRTLRAVALTLAALAPALPAQSETMVTAAQDPAMVEAVETARRHLDRVFDTAFGAADTAHPALTLKIAFPVEGDGTGTVGEEVIWVANIARDGGRFTATLANEPLHLQGLAAGDSVTFDRDMIADWSLLGQAELLFGHYTTRVLLDTMPADQAAPVRAILSEDPLPEAWQ